MWGLVLLSAPLVYRPKGKEMRNVNNYYYTCEKGHITVGQSNTKRKCDQKIQQVRLVKKGKAKVEKEVLKEGTCDAEIKETKEIPKELNLFEKWDYNVIKAFMTGQTNENLKIRFIECLQNHLNKLYEMKVDLKEKK